jgi:DNA-binding NarL/FixJ family response regulator
MKDKASILIADDHQMFLDGLKLILKNQPGISIVAEALDGNEVIRQLEQQEIDLALVDLNMPGLSGVELVKTIKQKFPQTKLLVITMHSGQEIISEILLAEAEGYILKNSGKKEVIEAITHILNGKTHYEKEVLSRMFEKVKADKKNEEVKKELSEREQQVFELIVQEFTSKEIAEKLFISKQTVDTHRINIMQKTQTKTLVGLIKYAVRAGKLIHTYMD